MMDALEEDFIMDKEYIKAHRELVMQGNGTKVR